MATPRELDTTLCPDDIYLGRTYWADLPWAQRQRFTFGQSGSEASRDAKLLWHMFVKDPFEPVRAYFRHAWTPGLGLFTEGATLFAIGNLSALFAVVWPQCWGKNPTQCDDQSVKAVSYSSIIGIIIGQVSMGVVFDWVGRRRGGIIDAAGMSIGLLMLSLVWGTSLQGWVAALIVSNWVYGVFVGGEYPGSSSSVLERRGTRRADRLRRGRSVQLAFSQQGNGQFFQQSLLLLGLLIFNGGEQPPFSKLTTQAAYRTQYGIIGSVTLLMLYLRVYRLKTSDDKLRKAKITSGYDSAALKLSMSHYWHRVLGTAGVWCMSDIVFYGPTLIKSRLISIVTGKSGADALFSNYEYNLLAIAVSILGYNLAAITIDYKWLGRYRLQLIGLAALFVLQISAAIRFETLTQKDNVKSFEAIYFLIQFFTQWGSNATTFLLAAELYPAEIRATTAGISAAWGKIGALAATVALAETTAQTAFYVTGGAAAIGMVLTLLFTADTTGLDLGESERYWRAVRAGREHEYHGVAVHPRHLSLFERLILKRHKAYDPELDRQARFAELEAAVRARSARKQDEKAFGSSETSEEEDDPTRIPDVVGYFENLKPAHRPSETSSDMTQNDGEIDEERRRHNMESLYKEMRRS
ncbi:hypothetical protein PYCC9005_002452 [Savitreella phatthalungensis]